MNDDTDLNNRFEPERSTNERPIADGGGGTVSHPRLDEPPSHPRGSRTRAILERLAGVFEANSYRWVQASFAFVFFYFGLQKWPVIQGASPVRPPVKAFVEAVGFGGWIPLSAEAGLLLIGIYEVTLGTLWLATYVEERRFGTSRLFVGVALMTIAHQLVTFFPLLLVPDVAFRQTQLLTPFAGPLPFPIALDWLSAFIFKNLLFLGAFFYYYVEWSERYGAGTSPSTRRG